MLDFKDTDIAGPEIEYAELETSKRLSNFKRQREALAGSYNRTSAGYDNEGNQDKTPENVYFEFQALMLPKMTGQLPVVDVGSHRKGAQEMVAKGAKHALNGKWIPGTSYGVLLEESATDYNYNFSVMHLSMRENPILGGDGDEPMPYWPEGNRISQEDYFCDPRAKGQELKRFQGHRTLIDKEDLIAQAKQENKEDGGEDDGFSPWEIESIEAIAPGSGENADDAPHRDQIIVREVWVPGYEDSDHPGPDAGYNGTLFTYGSSPEDEGRDLVQIRAPRPFYGPEWGPYYYGSHYRIPDDPYGVSSLTANEGLIRDLNRHAQAVSDSAARFKNIVGVDSTDPNFADAVRDAEHHGVLKMSGLTKDQVVPFSVGGITGEQMGYLDISRDRLNRNLGVSDAMRGVAEGRATATESSLATAAGDSRTSWIPSGFRKHHERFLKGVLWYMYHDDRFETDLPAEAAEEMGFGPNEELVFQGGDTDRESGLTFGDLELKIELFSMEHVSEAVRQRRTELGIGMLVQVSQIAPTAFWIPWGDVLQDYGESIGLPKLGSRWDQNMFEEYVALTLQQQLSPDHPDTQEGNFSKHTNGVRDVTPQPSSSAPQQGALGLTPPGASGQSTGATAGNLAASAPA